MHEHRAGNVFLVAQMLGTLGKAAGSKPASDRVASPQIVAHLESVLKECEETGLVVSRRLAHRLLHFITVMNPAISYGGLIEQLGALENAIEVELHTKIFFRIDPEYVSFF
jgi:hypothetical protein